MRDFLALPVRPVRWLIRGFAVAALLMNAAYGAEPGHRPSTLPTAFDLRSSVDDAAFEAGLGVGVHFTDGHQKDVERIAAAGFKVVRADLLWAKIETDRGVYDWRSSDELVSQLEKNGLTPLLLLLYSNPLYSARIAGRPDSPSLAYATPVAGAARAAYMAFVRAAVHRYGSHIIWEIWNEPDHNFGVPVDLPAYIDFAQEACRQIRGVSPDTTVIGPAASGFLWWFLRAFADADQTECFDAVSIHPYRDEPPESVLRDWDRARSMLSQYVRPGRHLALVNSEWGYSIVGGPWTAERQAEFDVRLRLLDLMSGIPMSIIYDWQDDGPDPADKEANFGLLDFHGSKKLSLKAMSDMVQELHGLRYMGRFQLGDPANFLLAFGDDAIQKVVAWSSTDTRPIMAISGPVCVSGIHALVATASDGRCGSDGFLVHAQGRLRLSPRPQSFKIRSVLETDETDARTMPGELVIRTDTDRATH